MMSRIRDRILRLAEAVQRDLDALYQSSELLAPEAPLNQAGLRDGLALVDEFLRHAEFGCAFEHLVYMLVEPDLALTQTQFQEMAAIGEQLELRSDLWRRVRVC